MAPIPAANGRFAQISGFRSTYMTPPSPRAPGALGHAQRRHPGAAGRDHYTLATNDFVNADDYTMLAEGEGVSREVMADVLADHIRAEGTITPAIEGRIIRLN